MSMSAGQVIVLEREGQWAAALRQALQSTRAGLVEIRSWAECWQRLTQCPTALIAAELSAANATQLVDALARLDREFPQAEMLVLADRRLAPYRGLLREAGALHFVTSPRRLWEVTEIVLRRQDKFQATIGAVSPTDEILVSLPWSDRIE